MPTSSMFEILKDLDTDLIRSVVTSKIKKKIKERKRNFNF